MVTTTVVVAPGGVPLPEITVVGAGIAFIVTA